MLKLMVVDMAMLDEEVICVTRDPVGEEPPAESVAPGLRMAERSVVLCPDDPEGGRATTEGLGLSSRSAVAVAVGAAAALLASDSLDVLAAEGEAVEDASSMSTGLDVLAGEAAARPGSDELEAATDDVDDGVGDGTASGVLLSLTKVGDDSAFDSEAGSETDDFGVDTDDSDVDRAEEEVPLGEDDIMEGEAAPVESAREAAGLVTFEASADSSWALIRCVAVPFRYLAADNDGSAEPLTGDPSHCLSSELSCLCGRLFAIS
ncbi:hypothetical protein NLG97_g10783 [Lecanicillium saksenae]|uniref:Uncharacterized protein n=1 Tax=Lecanicillium saksenae TaxID=468837 RepID=A0ACC1QDW8_9HYPO|nr:hypothetical protein NLG97_g10783 [Lecanicillium saksenae]